MGDLISQMLLVGVPIILAAYGGLISERSGIVNIGLEGIFITGAFSSVLFLSIAGPVLGEATPYIGLLVGLIAGVLYSALHAIPAVSLKADQIISGTALNMLAPALALFVVNALYSSYDMPLTDANTIFIRTELTAGITMYIPVILILGLVMALIIYLLFYRPFGLHLRACGENPSAADSMGINVAKMQYIGVLSSGALAGLGGAIYSLTIGQGFAAPTTVTGFGFLGLAALIFGKWKPLNTLLAALFFSFATALGSKAGVIFPSLPIPGLFWSMFPFVVTIIALVIFSRSAVGPKALGVPYDKGAR